jgi:hypothetical protein
MKKFQAADRLDDSPALLILLVLASLGWDSACRAAQPRHPADPHPALHRPPEERS